MGSFPRTAIACLFIYFPSLGLGVVQAFAAASCGHRAERMHVNTHPVRLSRPHLVRSCYKQESLGAFTVHKTHMLSSRDVAKVHAHRPFSCSRMPVAAGPSLTALTGSHWTQDGASSEQQQRKRLSVLIRMHIICEDEPAYKRVEPGARDCRPGRREQQRRRQRGQDWLSARHGRARAQQRSRERARRRNTQPPEALQRLRARCRLGAPRAAAPRVRQATEWDRQYRSATRATGLRKGWRSVRPP